jgi:diguanylate cyclase (GGDEF)-like protein/PAS domain S-box-containing protein
MNLLSARRSIHRACRNHASREVVLVQAVFRIRLQERHQVLWADAGVEALLGFKPEAFVDGLVSLTERIHPDDADVAAKIFQRNAGADDAADGAWLNLRVRHADGRIRCTRARIERERDSDGAESLRLTLEDVRRTGAARNGSGMQAHLRALIESSDDFVYFKDLHHVFTAASEPSRQAVFELSGQHEDVVGRTDYDLFPEEDADRHYGLEQAIFTGRPEVREVQRTIRRDGTEAWVDHGKFPVKDAGGAVIGLLGVARRISDPAGPGDLHLENAEQLHEAQRLAGVGSYVLDVATGTWTASEVLEEILGIDREYPHTVEGWIALIHPDDRARMVAYLNEMVVGQLQPFRRDYRIVRPRDGAERWVHGRGRLELDAAGRAVRLRGAIQDVTEQQLADLALRESRELLRLFIDHAPAALAMFDREMRYLAVSRHWLEMFDIDPTRVLGSSHYDILPGIPEEWKQAHRRALVGEAMAPRMDRLERNDGRVQLIRREVRPWFTGTGEVGGVILFAEDITQQRLAEERLHLAASVFTHAAEGIVITDAEGTILDVNDAFTRITGYGREEMIGKNPRLLKSDRQSPEFYKKMWEDLHKSGKWTGEIWNKAKCGRVFAEMLTISAVPDATGRIKQYVALFSDLTSIKEQEWKLERIAHYDLLTGLPNRELLADRQRQAMEQASGRGRVMAILSLDLDDFKAVNDRHGHNVGDQLLVAAAHRLKGVLRGGDTLARAGGDEFVAVLPDLMSAQDALPVLAQLQTAARTPFEVGQHVVRLSASVGVAFYPQPVDVDADQLLRQASQAMYHAKLEGKGRYHFYDPRQDLSVRGHHEDLERIRTALNSGELELYYQPRVNMRTGEVISAEALIRRQQKSGLRVLEETPLAIEVGEWVMDSALRQMESWNGAWLDLAVSVNVSAQQLQHPGFEAQLRRLLEAHPGVPVRRLELELLESGALTELAEVVALIERCGKLGVAFSLDDFGTGYSSLSYLRRLPFEVLKIDRTFVREMLDDPEDLTLLEGMLGLASAFRRQAVAEGVESVEHGVMLLRLGCEQGQGYGIARPMPAGEMAAWVRAWRPHTEWARAKTLTQDDWPLLHATVEHRAWIAAIAEYVGGCRKAPPAMEPTECRFGAWLQSARIPGQNGARDLTAVEGLHRRVHALAAEVLQQKASGRQAEALGGLANLQALRDQMLEELHRLAQ